MVSSFVFSPQKLVYGGDALGHHEGRPVLVPRALPGERLEVEPLRTVKGVVHARPLRVLVPAPERAEPPCPYFGRCGGCQYQHLGPERQGAVKLEILRETLRRLGKITWDGEIPLHTGPAWNYRNQAQLKLACQPDGRSAVGFFEAESHRVSPVDACLILSPRLNAILGELHKPEWSRRVSACREMGMLADDKDEQVMMTLRGNIGAKEAEPLSQDCLARLLGVVSVTIESSGTARTFGQATITCTVGGFRYRVSPGSFFQASRFLIPKIVDTATEDQSGTLALDLFAGVGLFTLPLAGRFAQVVAVEANPASAADLAANARAYGLEHIQTITGSVFDFLRRFARPEPDLVIVDPPRAGVGVQALRLLVGLRPRRIHYVSCSPPTLARDLGYLLGHGYRLDSIELFDFFPQTFHLECLAKLTPSQPASS